MIRSRKLIDEINKKQYGDSKTTFKELMGEKALGRIDEMRVKTIKQISEGVIEEAGKVENWRVKFGKKGDFVEVKAKSTREAVTKAGKKNGMSKDDALAASRDATVEVERDGKWV